MTISFMTLWVLYWVKLYLLLVLFCCLAFSFAYFPLMHLWFSKHAPTSLSLTSINSNISFPGGFCFVLFYLLRSYPSADTCPPVLVLCDCVFPGWLHNCYLGSSFDYNLGKSFCGSLVLISHFMLSIASYVLIYFSIYFAKKGHMSYKFFWVLDYLIIHLNLCDSFARYKFIVWKWFFPPLNI